MPRIHELFALAMNRYGVKGKDLAQLVGISAQHVTEFRKGRSWVSEETLESMLESMDHLSPGSKRYFCSLLANQAIARNDNKQQLVDLIENASGDEIEAVLIAIGKRWNNTLSSQSISKLQSTNADALPAYSR